MSLPSLRLICLTEASGAVRQAILPIRNSPEVRRHMYTDHLIGEEEHARWLESLKSHPSRRAFAVMRADVPVGLVNFSAIDTRHRRADWGFCLDPAAQKGTGSAMGFLALETAFGELELQKLNGEVLATNTPSLGFHRKLGFVEEGRRRRHIAREGETIDVVLFGITAEEWLGRRASLSPAPGT